MPPPLFVVVLATFNGATYVSEQVESIRAQTSPAWVLLVRDDGSTDSTREIIAGIAANDPRVRLLTDAHGNVGTVRNFELLLQAALELSPTYITLCDQDDRWNPQRLEVHGDLLRSSGASLVVSDLTLVDGSGRALGRTYWENQSIREPQQALELAPLLHRNVAVGAAMTLNAEAVRAALPFPTEIRMHDWWLALCAAALGDALAVTSALVEYRIHDGNQVGAMDTADLRPWRRSFWARIAKLRAVFVATFAQAEALRTRTATGLLPERAGIAAQAHRALLEGRAIERLRRYRQSDGRPSNASLDVLLQLCLVDPTTVERARRAARLP